MARKIASRRLTNCTVEKDGSAVTLDFISQDDEGISLNLPFGHAEAISMTLPQLLTTALKMRSGDNDARYVFPLGKWTIEKAQGSEVLICTFTTVDGFQASFGIPYLTARTLGQTLEHEAGKREPTNDLQPPKSRLN